MSSENKIELQYLHECYPSYARESENIEGHGPAVEICGEREDGSLWVENGEYSSRVNFCPFCGYAAKNKIVDGENMIIHGPVAKHLTEDMLNGDNSEVMEYYNDYYEGIIEGMRQENIKSIEECNAEYMRRYEKSTQGFHIAINIKNREISMLKAAISLMSLFYILLLIMAVIK